MESASLTALLLVEEESLRAGLKADTEAEQGPRQSLEKLKDTYGRLLLRYNADNSAEPARQALADCLTATAQDSLGLLGAAGVKKELSRGKLRPGAVICLLLSVIFCLLAALLVQQSYPAGCVCVGCAALFAFLGGLLWKGERRVKVRAVLDPEVTWNTLRKTVGPMDRKMEEFSTAFTVREKGSEPEGAAAGDRAFPPEELKLYGDLLEALYAENGEYALRQLKKVRGFLLSRGVELRDYSPGEEELFEVLPTRRTGATQRPALLLDGALLLPGRATEHVDG